MIVGDRGTGKSTLLAAVARCALQAGLKVFTQYPYKDCYVIPMVPKIIDGVEKYDIDKSWLYNHDLSDSVVLLDECRTVYPARSWSKWTQSDDEFFNFLRKNRCYVFLATQVYDAVDLNVKRACDETWYLTKGWFFTNVEASHTTVAKVADKNTEVLGRLFKAGMMKVEWQICEVPVGNFKFYRKPYYNDFDTNFTFDQKPIPELVPWNDNYDGFNMQDNLHKSTPTAAHPEADPLSNAQNMQDNLQK
ncbi:MAG: zonular occludens toxin domain-containing protein [Acutalibacteraceae bacterium]|jgi:hypothetical protein